MSSKSNQKENIHEEKTKNAMPHIVLSLSYYLKLIKL